MDPLGSHLLLAQATFTNNAPLIIVITLLVFLSAFFSGAETAFTNCNMIYIRAKSDAGNNSAKLVKKIVDRYDKSLATILIGNNIVNILISSLSTIVAIAIFVSETQATLFSTIIMTVVVFIFGELLPKNICKVNADRMALILVYPLWLLDFILTPISFIFRKLVEALGKIFKRKNNDNDFDEEDLQLKVDEMEKLGELGNEESEIIQAAVDFTDTTIITVMTPIEKVVTIDINGLTKKKLIDTLCDIKYSRVPVYSKNTDNILGVLHIKKFLKGAMNNQNFSIKSILSEPVFVGPNVLLDDMVEIFKKEKIHMAFVKDEALLGIVTMEDVIEELIGDVNKGGAN